MCKLTLFSLQKSCKIFLLSTKAIVGSFPTGFDIQRIAINNDFIFTGSKCGNIEVWLKERFTRVASIKMSCGGHTKFTSLTSDIDGGMLYAASSDGKIQVRDAYSINNFVIFFCHYILIHFLIGISYLQVWELD